MPSPFPGMDPYLEAPHRWPDLHDRLASQISSDLNTTLPPPYYARLDMRPEVGIVDDERHRTIIPDVAVALPPSAAAGRAAVLDAPRRKLSASHRVTIRSERSRHTFVEIRDPTEGHQLITLIEIASPSKKRPAADRRAYFQKQGEILDSSASLIELDLLRTGARLFSDPSLEESVAGLEPSPQYLVLVNRAWQRVGDASDYEIFPILLAEPLPCIPVPLREGQEETPLDLQYAFQRAYDTGPYRRGMVDYDEPPQPPLEGDWATWASECVRAWRAAPSA